MTAGDLSDWALPERTNEPYDAPSALQLISAVRRYLGEDLMPRSAGADRWLLRVATNALTIAAREIELGDGHRSAHQARLARFDCSSDAELSATIRSGALDDRLADAHAAILATVLDKLAVANPEYVESDR